MEPRNIKTYLFVCLVSFALAGCSAIAPTPTPTVTPLPTATYTPTINAEATQTVQAQSTATAQANATRTAQALSQATAQAQATARAQSTAAARAGATATIQAFVAGINAISQAVRSSPYLSSEGKVDGQPSPYLTAFDPNLTLKNFDVEVQFLNPADRAIHPWDYGIAFRHNYPLGYSLTILSTGEWVLFLTQKGIADAMSGKVVASGVIAKFDSAETGSNTVRLFVRDGTAAVFVNGEFVSAMDVSEYKDGGAFYISTAGFQGNNFPGLTLRYKNLVVKGLP